MVRPAERSLLLAVVAAALCVSAAAVGAAGAQRPARPMRVLLLFQQQAETPPMIEFTRQFRLTITRESGRPVELYQESLDLDRFAGRENSLPLAHYFADKYKGFEIDAVVPVGGRALRFALDELRKVLPSTPVVFALNAAPQTDISALPDNVTGRLAPATRFAPTLQLARALQPNAAQIVIVGGAGEQDSTTVAAAASVAGGALPVTILQGIALDDLLRRLRAVPRQSIVLFANFRRDAGGQAFDPIDIMGSIARASAAPMYTQLRSYVGEGVVGGSVVNFEGEGSATARLVIGVLRRRVGEPMPRVESIPSSFVADWRQLERWQLDRDRLPSGTIVLFHERTPWQRYRTAALLTIGIIAAEAVLIGALLLERRRRRRTQLALAEQERRFDETRRRVTHMGRIAIVGELAATVAHELRQPLAAILANAETGAKLARRNVDYVGARDWELNKEIFDDIVAETALASDVIARIRTLLRSEDVPHQDVDVNEICRTCVRLLQHEVLSRHATIALALDPRAAKVTGDPIQLQQVVLNLAMNALDAAGSSTLPRVVIESVAHETSAEIVIRDNGPGLRSDVREHLFESFFTTKTHGLGLGLVIVQTIVERHHGSVRAENGEQGDGNTGAVFRVELPRAATHLPTLDFRVPEAAVPN